MGSAGVRRCLDLLSVVHLGHSSHSSTSKSRVLVAVAPAVYGSLDESALASEGNIELCERPSNSVAVGLIHEAVSAVLLLGAAGSGIDAVLLLELGRELISVDRLDIAANGVLHLNSVPGVLESNPLHTVAVLSDHKRGRRGDGPGSRIGIDTRSGVSRALELSAVLGVMSLGHGRGLRLLELKRDLGFDLGSGATGHASMRVLLSGVLGGVLAHLVLRSRLRHHHVGLRCHRLLWVRRMLRVGRRGRLRGHGLVLALRVVH